MRTNLLLGLAVSAAFGLVAACDGGSDDTAGQVVDVKEGDGDGGAVHDEDGGSAVSCAAIDARGEGACRAIVGHAWDGTKCVTLGGCECVGADCAIATPVECARRQTACSPDASSVADSGPGQTYVCDARRVECRRAEPSCPTGQAASVNVEERCWGPCVDVTSCRCSGPNGAAECPKDHVCHGSTFACGPLVR